MVNEGLEVLGTDEYAESGRAWRGVFERSAVENVALPSTLRKIEYRAFRECKNLKHVKLPEALEYIRAMCFSGSGLEEVKLPASVRTVAACAFYRCEQLRCAELNEGLEVIGERWCDGGKELDGMVFAESGIESIRVPSTVTEIRSCVFARCSRLKRVEFAEGLEALGGCENDSDQCGWLFKGSGVQEVVLPSTLRQMSPDIFKGCDSLRVVRVARGCPLDVRKFVGSRVKVR